MPSLLILSFYHLVSFSFLLPSSSPFRFSKWVPSVLFSFSFLSFFIIFIPFHFIFSHPFFLLLDFQIEYYGGIPFDVVIVDEASQATEAEVNLHTLSLFLSLTHPHTLVLSPVQTLIFSHTHSHSLFKQSLFLNSTFSYTLSLPHSQTSTLPLILSLSLSLSPTHSLFLPLAHSPTLPPTHPPSPHSLTDNCPSKSVS